MGASSVFRILRRLVGWSLILLGSALTMIFTSSFNVAESPGPPMAVGWIPANPLAILILELIFMCVILGGVKLCGFGWSVFGSIVIVAGVGSLCLGVWHQIDGPPLDYDSTSTDTRMPLTPSQNGIVYLSAGLITLSGLLLTAIATRARRNHN